MIIVKGAIENLKVLTENPMIILVSKKEYFGSLLPKKVIESLLIFPGKTYFEKNDNGLLKRDCGSF